MTGVPKLRMRNWVPDDKGDFVPEGVELVDPHDYTRRRQLMFEKAKAQFQRSFPKEYNGVRVELEDVDYADPEEVELAQQKKQLLQNGTIARRLRGTMRLVDVNTGAELDRRTMTLARIPYLTQRGTIVHNGSDYAVVTQSRLAPGVFTRRRENGQIETQFSTRRGTGRQFRIGFDPESAQYQMAVGGGKLHLYSLLKDMGRSDEELKQRWGDDVFAANSARYDARVLPKAYAHFVPARERIPDADVDTMRRQIERAWRKSQVQAGIARRNLPNLYDRVKAAAWKEAGEAKFEPDFTPEQLSDVYNSIYGKVGPRLASMKAWPESWMHPDDPLGWLEWYEKYSAGRRHPDDERQIRRWRGVKARFAPLVRDKLSPRAAYALRNWAIDAEKLVDTEKLPELRERMAAYRSKQELKDQARETLVDPEGAGEEAVKRAFEILAGEDDV